MEENMNFAVSNKAPAPLDYYTDKKKKKMDFWLGFGGSFIGNVLLILLYLAAMPYIISNQFRTPTGGSTTTILADIANEIIILLPWVLNIGAIIVSLILHRRYITFGILASYGAALVLTIIAGIVFTILCFASGLN